MKLRLFLLAVCAVLLGPAHALAAEKKTKDRERPTKAERTQLENGELPPRIAENELWVQPTTPEGQKFQTEMTRIYNRVFPQKDFPDNRNIRFIISADDEPNAYYYSLAKPPVIVMTRGLLRLVDNEDQIAWVLGHEAVHKHLSDKDQKKVAGNSKPEEYYADIRPLPLLADAGYDVRQAKIMARKIFGDGKLYDPIEVLDVHGLPGNRLEALDKGTALLLYSRGALSASVEATTTGVFRDLAEKAHEQTLLSKQLSDQGYEKATVPEKLNLLRKAVALIGPEYPRRSADLERLIRALPDSAKNSPEAHALADSITALARKKTAQEDYAKIAYWLSEALGGGVTEGFLKSQIPATESKKPVYDYSSRGLPARPLGALAELAARIQVFLNAKEPEAIHAAAAKVREQVRQLDLPIRFLQDMHLPAFFVPNREFTLQAKQFDSAKHVAPWWPHLQALAGDSSGAVAEVLWQLGIEDPAVVERLPVEEMEAYLIGKRSPIVKDDLQEGVGMRSLSWDENGVLSTRPILDRSREVAAMTTQHFLKNFVPLVAAGFQGDKQAQAKALVIAPHLNLSSLFPIGLGHLEKSPEFFVTMNDLDFARPVYGDTRDADAIHDRNEAMEILMEGTLKRVTELLEQNASAHRDAVRKVLLGLSKNYGYPELNRYMIADTHGIFSREEKLAIASGPHFLSDGESQLTEENVRDRDYAPLYRFMQVENSGKRSDFLEAVERLSKIRSLAAKRTATILFVNFEAKTPKDELTSGDVLRVLPWLDDEILGECVDTKRWVKSRLFSDYGSWPKDPESLAAPWKAMRKLRLFPEDRQFESEMLEYIIQKIPGLPLGRRQKVLEELLADGQIDFPKLRTAVQELWVKGVLEKYGKDKGDLDYQQTLSSAVHGLAKRLNARDRLELVDAVATKLEAQPALSTALSAINHVEDRRKMEKGHTIGLLSEAGAEAVRRHDPSREAFLNFLSAPLTDVSVSRFMGTLRINSFDFSQMNRGPISDPIFSGTSDKEKEAATRLLHENFWSLPFQARVPAIDALLLPPPAFREGHELGNVVDKISKALFPAGERYSAQARTLLRKYIERLDDDLKTPFLAAVLAANDKSERAQEKLSVSQKLALVLEQMGPAEVKLGQAIHSYPDAPEDLRSGMGRLKSDTGIPTREEMIELYRKRVPESEREKVKHIGRILGAASYYITVEVELFDGTSAVVSLLRPHAKERAQEGFRKMAEVASDLGRSDPLQKHLVQVIDHASRMADVETDSNAYKKQFDTAEKNYSGYEIEVDGHKFTFAPAKLLTHGEGYRFSQKAKGEHFNKLPESTPEQQRYRKNLARAYVTLELIQVFSGEEFDHDRHGDQMRVDGETVILFDHGAMSLEPPTQKQRELLGKILAYAINQGQSDWTQISGLVMSAARQLRATDPETSDYLVKIQNAFLKLTDFTKHLDPTDRADILAAVLNHGRVHPDIAGAIQAKLQPDKAGALMQDCGKVLIQISRTNPSETSSN
ncbi:M48 family metalloprotease [bacterium]|nr:M48 family metalloprotease [bacterium]